MNVVKFVWIFWEKIPFLVTHFLRIAHINRPKAPFFTKHTFHTHPKMFVAYVCASLSELGCDVLTPSHITSIDVLPFPLWHLIFGYSSLVEFHGSGGCHRNSLGQFALIQTLELFFLLFDGGASPCISVTSASLVMMPLAGSTSDTFSAKSHFTISK